MKIGLGALIFDKEGKILLMYRKNCEFYNNCWFIPCGKLEEKESIIDGIKREVREETSLEIDVGDEIYNKMNEYGILEIAHICKILKGIPKIIESKKCLDIGFFDLDELPKNTHKKTLIIINEYKNKY